MLPRVHAITDGRVLALPDLQARVLDIARHGGALALHVRDREASASDFTARVTMVMHWLRGSGVLVLVNSRPDIARALEAGGVQLGARDLAPADARAVLGPGWIGRSLHGHHELAQAAGADFAVMGPLFPTASHPDAPALGAHPLPMCEIPVVAIGGITLGRVRTVRQAGYHGVAAIRAIWDTSSPGAAVAAMLEEAAG